MELYKFLKKHGSYEPGAIVQLDDNDSKGLLKDGIIEKFAPKKVEKADKKGFFPGQK